MKELYTIAFAVLTLVGVMAQPSQVEQGASYANTVYLDLESGATTTTDLISWDIAFGASPFSGAIFVNEGTPFSFGPASETELYGSTATDFATADTTQITSRLYNSEAGWSAGAFNETAVPGVPSDLGWGDYSFATNTVTGNQVYFIKDRADVWRKLFVESLISNVYTFRYAELDGSNETTVTIDKADYAGKTLAYYSFETGELNLEPAEWDLMFTRYTTPLPDGEGNIINYTLTGVIHNDGIGVVERSGVDPASEPLPTNPDDYDPSLDAIGYDWKTFTGSWDIPDDRVYFVRLPTEEVYRIQFLDFTGSSSGITTFLAEPAGIVSNVSNQPAFIETATLFPNPARQFVNLRVNSQRTTAVRQLRVLNNLGQTMLVESNPGQLRAGMNQFRLETDNLPAGSYYVQLVSELGILSMPLQLVR